MWSEQNFGLQGLAQCGAVLSRHRSHQCDLRIRDSCHHRPACRTILMCYIKREVQGCVPWLITVGCSIGQVWAIFSAPVIIRMLHLLTGHLDGNPESIQFCGKIERRSKVEVRCGWVLQHRNIYSYGLGGWGVEYGIARQQLAVNRRGRVIRL